MIPSISLSGSCGWARCAGVSGGLATGAYAVNELLCLIVEGLSDRKEQQYVRKMTSKFNEFKALHKNVSLKEPIERNLSRPDELYPFFRCPISEAKKYCGDACDSKVNEMYALSEERYQTRLVESSLFLRVQYVAIPLIAAVVAYLTFYAVLPVGVPLALKVSGGIIGGIVMGAWPAIVAPLSRFKGCCGGGFD